MEKKQDVLFSQTQSDVWDDRIQFLHDYHTCGLCGGELEFSHRTHFIKMESIEEAECPSCQVRAKRTVHKLQ